jgi:hypothetical protein
MCEIDSRGDRGYRRFWRFWRFWRFAGAERLGGSGGFGGLCPSSPCSVSAGLTAQRRLGRLPRGGAVEIGPAELAAAFAVTPDVNGHVPNLSRECRQAYATTLLSFVKSGFAKAGPMARDVFTVVLLGGGGGGIGDAAVVMGEVTTSRFSERSTRRERPTGQRSRRHRERRDRETPKSWARSGDAKFPGESVVQHSAVLPRSLACQPRHAQARATVRNRTFDSSDAQDQATPLPS